MNFILSGGSMAFGTSCQLIAVPFVISGQDVLISSLLYSILMSVIQQGVGMLERCNSLFSWVLVGPTYFKICVCCSLQCSVELYRRY